MTAEQKRAWMSLAVCALFAVAAATLLASHGAGAFDPAGGGTPWITRLSGFSILLLAIAQLLFRGRRSGGFTGDERDRAIAERASLVAKTLVLLIVFGGGIGLQLGFAEQDTIPVPRLAVGFALACLMGLYLGIRALFVLILYGAPIRDEQA